MLYTLQLKNTQKKGEKKEYKKIQLKRKEGKNNQTNTDEAQMLLTSSTPIFRQASRKFSTFNLHLAIVNFG